ncbi:unnamed protein product [Amoebophrya sp. A120]|nr:unnamed protein product [Amoebophrya sp. A120]|eukprot:GSA120T00006072001.1
MAEEIMKLANANGQNNNPADPATKKKDSGPDLSEYGYNRVSVIGRGQYGIAQLVSRCGEPNVQLVAKSVQVDALNEHDQKLAQQEVQLLQQMRHPHIIGYIESFSLTFNLNILVIVMEYAPHGDLRKLIKSCAKKKEQLEEVVIMRWFTQLLHALNYIHRQKILHRDLKTSNIFLDGSNSPALAGVVDNAATPPLQDYNVKLGDFGISRVLDGTREAAVTVVGTPYYMSPEVCRSEPYNWKSDVWALGCVLYELCMLKHAFESSSLLGLVYKIVSEHYDPIPDQYSTRLMDLIKRLLTKSAEARPETTEILLDPYVSETAERLQLPPDNDPFISLSPVRGKPKSEAAIKPPPPPPGAKPLSVSAPPGPPPPGSKRPGPPPPPPSSPPVQVARPSTTALQIPAENQELFEVLMARIRAILVTRKSNWISTFASFDKKGDGIFQTPEFVQALQALNCALSSPEINFLVACFASGAASTMADANAPGGAAGSGIPLFHFAEQLNTAPGPLAKRVDASVRDLFDPEKLQMLFERCTAADPERRGVVTADAFKISIAHTLQDQNNERNVMLALMSSEKNLVGDVDYRDFVQVFQTKVECYPFTSTALQAQQSLNFTNSTPGGSPGTNANNHTQFFTCRGAPPLAPLGIPVPPGGGGPSSINPQSTVNSRSGSISKLGKPPETPFRAMTAENLRVIWARLKKKFVHCTLKDVWQVYFQQNQNVNPYAFIDLCSDIPFGVSRAELHQCCAMLVSEESGGQVNIDEFETHLLMADETILNAVPSWGKVMQDLLQDPEPLFRDKSPTTKNKSTVPESDFRAKLCQIDQGLTSHQVDFLISLVDKTSEGDIQIHPRRATDKLQQPVDLTPEHYNLVCRRLVVKLRNCALDVPKLTKILLNFWSIPEWSKCLSMLLPLYLSEAEATGLMVRLLEGQYEVDQWAAEVQQVGEAETVGLQVDKKVAELLHKRLTEPISGEEFLALLQQEFPLEYAQKLYSAADKSVNGFVLASSWLADEGIVSVKEAKALKKKRSFLSRMFK